MSAREELYRVVRDLKSYLRWQQAGGAPGSVPAAAAEREAFEAKKAAREQAKIERIKASFQAESEPRANASRSEKKADDGATMSGPQGSVQKPEMSGAPQGVQKPALSDPQRGIQAPDSEPSSDAEPQGPSPWKKIGSRPKRRFGANKTPGAEPSSSEPKSKPERANKSSASDKSGDQPPPFDDAAYPEAAGMIREGTVEQPEAGPQAASAQKSASEMSKREKLDFLRDYMGDCRRCGLCEGRTNIAFGTGDAEAKLVFVGEAPGFNEDKQGEPFVGKAGQLLDKMIEAMGLTREQVYICNVIKCRPPDNRNPHADEIRECSPFLRKQLAAIEPEIIVTLGKFASQFITGQQKSMGALRGRWHQWEDVAVMPTYHPAYLLRSPDQKGKTWSDLQMVMERLEA